MITRKTQATLVLIIMILGFILTYNANNIWLNVLNAGFLAGTIGGLADWFAITALFRKPLGFITFKTEILPRNRERIINEIVDFFGSDLLHKDYLLAQLNKVSLVGIIVNYGKSPSVHRQFNALGKEIALILAGNLSLIIDELKPFLKSGKLTANQSKLWSNIIYKQLLKDSPLLVKLWLLIINCIEYILHKDFMHQFLDYHVENIKEKYVGNHFVRSIALGVIDLSGESLAQKLIAYLEGIKIKLKDKDSRQSKYFRIKFARKIRGFLNNPENWLLLRNFLLGALENYLGNIVEKQQRDKILGVLEEEVSYSMVKSLQDEHNAEILANWLKVEIINFITTNANLQIDYLRGELNRYSNEELITLVESKVGDDLQMIRINGSLVGSLAGMSLYLLSLGVERLWG